MNLPTLPPSFSLSGETRPLQEIILWVTDRCVYRCPYCQIPEHVGPYLPVETAVAAVRDGLPHGLKWVTITGGDPMMHPRFTELAHGVRDLVESVCFHATGKLVDDEVLDRLEEKGRRWSWWLTLVSHRRELNDIFRAAGAVEDVRRSAALLLRRGHRVDVQLTVVPESLEHLEETVAFAFDEIGAASVTTCPVGPVGRAMNEPRRMMLDDERLRDYYRRSVALAEKWKAIGKVVEPITETAEAPARCSFDWTRKGMTLLPDGSTVACCYVIAPETALGHISEGMPALLSLERDARFDRAMAPAFARSEARREAMGRWTCLDCVFGFQARVRGNREYELG